MINSLIAYGGFNGYWDDLITTYWLFFKFTWFMWVMAIIIPEKTKDSRLLSLIGISLFLLVATILPALGVMGKYGPAHIASEYASYSCMMASIYLIIKMIIYRWIHINTKNKKQT